jgi:hypothetical protein
MAGLSSGCKFRVIGGVFRPDGWNIFFFGKSLRWPGWLGDGLSRPL